MTTKVTSEFLHQAIISDHTQVSAADADHILIHDASDNTLKKALVSTITGSGTTINNNADNRIITGSSSSGTLEAEGDLTYSGGSNAVGNLEKGTSHLRIKTASSIFLHHSGTTAGNQVQFYKGSDSIPHFTIGCQSGSDDTELTSFSSGDMVFKVVESGGSTYTALTLDGDGQGDVIFGGDIKKTSGNLTLDVAGQINLDADGGFWNFNDGGTTIGYIENSSSNLVIRSHVNDKDIIFTGTDNNSGITAAFFDMSDAGRLNVNGGIDLPLGTDIEANYGDWTGEKSGKLQFHGGHFYIQVTNSLYYRTYSSGSGNDRISFDNGGNIVAEGNITAYGSVSDERLKENIEVIDNAVDKVKQLKGITFNYKKDGKEGTGLIAQDLEKVLPEAVYTAKALGDHLKDEKQEEHLAINYGNTVGLLVEAIKELSAKIEKLEGK